MRDRREPAFPGVEERSAACGDCDADTPIAPSMLYCSALDELHAHDPDAKVQLAKAGRPCRRSVCSSARHSDTIEPSRCRHGSNRVGFFCFRSGASTCHASTTSTSRSKSAFSARPAWSASSSSRSSRTTRGSGSTWLGASQRSEGKPYRDAAAWRLPAPLPDDVAKLTGGRGRAGPRAEARVLRPRLVGGRRDRRRVRRAPVTSSSATRATTGWSATVPLLIPEVNADHLALLDAQAARAAGRAASSPTRTARPSCSRWRSRRCASSACKTVHGHDAAGDLGRGLSGRAVVGHPRQRHSVHRRRGREDSRPRRRRSSARCRDGARRAASGDVSAHDDARAGARRAHESISVGARRSSRPHDAIIEAFERRSAGGRRSSDLPSAPPQPIVYLTERNRPQPALDVDRGGGMTVTRRPPAPAARCSTTSSSRSGTTRFAAPRAPRS